MRVATKQLLPFTRKTLWAFNELRSRSSSAEVCNLLERLNLNRDELVGKLAGELVKALNGLAVNLAGSGTADPKEMEELNSRIAPLIDLLNTAPPRDYSLDRDVFYAALHKYSNGTYFHSERVSESVEDILEFMPYEYSQRKDLEIAARLHDIGKISVPREILNKPGSFDAAEKNIMNFHQSIGFMLLRDIKRFRQIADIMSFTHIEQGYPAYLLGKPVPLLSHILIIADTWDACLCHREYRRGSSLSTSDAFNVIAGHNKPRHPLVALIATAHAYEVDREDARRILLAAFPAGRDQTKIAKAF